jgi:cell division protein FtsB
MHKSTVAFGVTLALCCVGSSAPAQVSPPDAGPSRYSFNRVDNGFLRLDNQSGQVAYCGPHAVGWACEVVPEDRAALEKEIARLQDEVTSLRREVANLREPSPPRPPAELAPPADNRDDTARLREDMERARAALEHAWRGLVDMIITFQKDMMRKG